MHSIGVLGANLGSGVNFNPCAGGNSILCEKLVNKKRVKSISRI